MACFTLSASAQMIIDGQTLYGNEWIDYDKNYIKLTIDQDGIYKVDYSDLLAQGIPAGVVGSGIQVYNMGKQVLSKVSSDGSWTNGDHIIFYGERNRGEMDAFLYADPDAEQLNQNYSMFTDDNSYYISWGNSANSAARYAELDNNVNGTNILPKNFYLHKEELVLSNLAWSPAAPEDSDINYSTFIMTEGFGNRLSKNHEFTLPAIDVTNGPRATLNYRLGTNTADHNILVYFNDFLIETEAHQGMKIVDKDHTINLVDIESSNKLTFDAFRDSDRYIVSTISITYPRKTDARNESLVKFRMQENSNNNHYRFENFDAGSENYVFDVSNGQFLIPEMTGSTANFLIDRSGPDQSLVYLMNETGFLSPKSFESLSFENIDDVNPEYLILTSELLDITENGSNYVQEYADFRSSQQGGSYRTEILHAEDIIEQFGYGIKGHSYAIKNFSNYIKERWPDFSTVLLLGKGLDYSNRNKQTLIKSFVPTYGKPGSDNYLFSEGDLPFPYVAIGRVAVNNQEQIRDYLDKIKVHSRISDIESLSIEERLWLKNVLHLSGGGPSEQTALFNYLESMSDTIENNLVGASVKTYQKTSSDPVQTTLSQQILDDINSGISMLTFFGHSSQGTFDFSIEDPREYENYGKWPVMLAMGCKAGDVNANLVSLSEQMVLTKDLGAIAFFASSGNAYPPMLADMGREYYSLIGGEYYGEPIGETMRVVLENQYAPGNYRYVTLHEQNILHGDPAVRMFAAPGPDFVVDFSSVSTKDDIGTQDEFIDISFDIVNLGRGGVQDSMSNYVVHNYAEDQNDTIYFNTIAPQNRVTVELTIPNPGQEGVGKNTINIVLDYDNKYEELPTSIAEENNDLRVAYNNEGYCFFVFDNSAFPIYPTEFSIVYNQGITLKASTSNAFSDKQTYIFEIDTTELFNSPLLERSEVASSPGLIEWAPTTQYQNEVVYYWRIIPKDVENTIWNTSSFVYLDNGAEGWNQSHFYQWQKDEYETYGIDPSTREFLYADNIAAVQVTNVQHRGSNTANPVIVALNDPQEYLEFVGDGNIKSGVYVSVFDGSTGLPWINQPVPNSLYGSVVGSSWAVDRYFFPYWTRTPAERELAMSFLEDVVPDGDYIVFYTVQRSDVSLDPDYQPEEWAGDAAVVGRDLFSILEDNGATRVRELANGAKPYIFAYRKGDPSWAPKEVIADNVASTISLDFTIQGAWDEGSVQSTTIGPAQAWDKLLWSLDDLESQDDVIRLSIIGIDADGNEVVLFDEVDNFDFDLSSIDAAQYPYLKLNLYSQDETSRTSAQMEYWRVLYSAIPEAVLNTTDKFVFNNDTLQIGQPLMLSTVATNVTESDMDSLLVKYTIVDDNNAEFVELKRVAPLKGGESVDIDYEYPTTELNGIHQFIVEINPDEDQREQFDFNNIGIIDFTILGDKINPLLDVTFDGMHIMDGDIVSPTPNICITLRDESDQFFIDDISNFDLALQALPDQQSYPIDLTSDNIIFTPADSTREYAKLEFLPELESGEYILYVQGEDRSGNLSGDQDVEVRFQVIKESSLSNVLNYPNPFSTSTQFVFTLTGNDVPDVFTIQIMTLSGKVVKEITKEEMGNLRIGVNRTDYKWNGTDEFGNKLANGVYLYRVLTSHSDDEEIQQLNNQNVDSFFTKGFGKMVIMR
jgi:hypothetical protein